jgi:hypothetical protein
MANDQRQRNTIGMVRAIAVVGLLVVAGCSGARAVHESASASSPPVSAATTPSTERATIPAPATTDAPVSTVSTVSTDTTYTEPAGVTVPTSKAAPPAGGVVIQDMSLSPGAADPRVTQANIHETICVVGYSASVRDVSAATKRRVFAEYGISNPAPGAYEVDHLIPLELGGSNDITNLWPEPYTGPANARDKDVWENRLHKQVCLGQITLAVAQDEMVHWWLLLDAVPSGSSVGAPAPATGVPATQGSTAASTDIKPGAFCTPVGAHGTYHGQSYLCSTTKANGTPYAGGRARWRKG